MYSRIQVHNSTGMTYNSGIKRFITIYTFYELHTIIKILNTCIKVYSSREANRNCSLLIPNVLRKFALMYISANFTEKGFNKMDRDTCQVSYLTSLRLTEYL